MASQCQNLSLAIKPTSFKCTPFIPNNNNKVSFTKTTSACMNANIIACSSSNSKQQRLKYIPNKILDPGYVRVLDTTLRDGEQTLGVNFSIDQKLEIAHQLVRLGVDIIEAGFPASSPEAAEAVKRIALAVGNGTEEGEGHVPVINALSRCVKADIDAAWESLRGAKYPRITLFVATSEIHMKHKLRKSRQQVLALMRDSLRYAQSLGAAEISFGAEDTSRTDKDFLYEVLEGAIDAGATTLILADTVGYMFPHEWGMFTADVRSHVRGIEGVVLGTHCHDDLGMATANTLAAVEAGVRQVEGTINGIGERAGNAALEEVIMGIKCRGHDLLHGLRTGIDSRLLAPTSQMVEDYSGVAMQTNKAIVGANIFSHGSGIHQDGVLKHRGTYEILSPEDVGISRSDDLGIVLGKHSGRSALQSRLQQLGYEVQDTKFEQLFLRFKQMAQDKKQFSDGDVKSLVLGV